MFVQGARTRIERRIPKARTIDRFTLMACISPGTLLACPICPLG
jgi:hypothetical protein